MAPDKEEALLHRVRSLLAKADSTEFPEEAEAFREKANSLMAVHAIESWKLEMGKDANERIKPEIRDVEWRTGIEEVDDILTSSFRDLVKLCRCVVAENNWRASKVVGYSVDLNYLEMMLTSVTIYVTSRMKPSATPDRDYLNNLYVLKSAGYKWQQVYENMVLVHPDRFLQARVPDEEIVEARARHGRVYPNRTTPWEETVDFKDSYIFTKGGYFHRKILRNIGVRFTGEYAQFCQDTGKPRVKISPSVYVRSFVQGFKEELAARIWRLTNKASEESAGSGLVLASREGDLMEFLYDLYPAKRPHPRDCDCVDCHFMRCNDTSCERERCKEYWKRQKNAKPVRYRAYNPPITDAAAMSSGRAAAREVDLSGSTGRIANKQRGIEG